MSSFKRVILIVLDSCGVGGATDAAKFGDEGANTIGHAAEAVGGIKMPHLEAMGLGYVEDIQGVGKPATLKGAYGRMAELSAGKDTTSGHWEIAGVVVKDAFGMFPDGFSTELIEAFAKRTGRGVLGNKVASGTTVLDELGPEHIKSGKWIVYTSADSVFQIAAHTDVVPLEELYRACEVARELCDPLRVGRVIARPFTGKVGAFKRTYDRRDFGIPPTGETVLDRLVKMGVEVVGVGKISDIFCGRGVSASIHTEGNADGVIKTIQAMKDHPAGLVFVNLIDFDSSYGHRRDPQGFARCLEAFDRAVPDIVAAMSGDDLLMITADHGNDPTYKGTDHTREQVPLLCYHHKMTSGKSLGTRKSYSDVAATILENFGAEEPANGTSFWSDL